MKAILVFCTTGFILFLSSPLAAASPKAASYFEGIWIGEGYSCEQGGLREKVQISISGNSLIARKLTGDNCVPAGNITFQGTLPNSVDSGSSFPVTWTVGTPQNPASGRTQQNLTILDNKSFTSFGVKFTREGNIRKERVKVWLNTFIPTRVAEIRIGKNPLVCLHADNRGFSSDLNVSSRTHQVIELEVETDGNQVTNIAPITTDERNRVGESYFADCRTGNRLDKLPSRRASIRDISNSWEQQGNNVIVKFFGRIGLPLLPSCPIDFDINVLIDPIAKTYRVVGGRDGFPAYEAYLQVGNNSLKPILNYNPIPLGINPVSANGLCMWDKRNPVSESGKF
ncbi:hypothetical protein [Pantanalinema sp. GBBB05]|uniref:hypothetical protein n=1 Tax=Pantanalinema sp. GBBB05 TaxID=2604139 RepID=UPI001DE135C5|nr:hypothetical protein [Pantanalinema sp. GBBB05]